MKKGEKPFTAANDSEKISSAGQTACSADFCPADDLFLSAVQPPDFTVSV